MLYGESGEGGTSGSAAFARITRKENKGAFMLTYISIRCTVSSPMWSFDVYKLVDDFLTETLIL